jgi:exopolysaccharide production protein ExoQ
MRGGRGESPAFLGKGETIVTEPAKSNDPLGRPFGLRAETASAWCEAGLAGCVLVLPPLLALVPRGAAPLAAVAGLCAAGLIAATRRPGDLAAWRYPAALLGALLLWGALSAAWAPDPWRSLGLTLRLAGSFAGGLALAAAASRVAAPGRLALCLLAGTGLAILLAAFDLASSGGLSGYVTERPFAAPRLNQIAVWLAVLLLPCAALLVGRGRVLLALAVAAAMTGTVYLLDGTAAKTALAVSLPAAALLYWRRALVARVAAALLMLFVLTAPVTLPLPAQSPAVFATVDAFKDSAGHRLLIWSFAGERIAQRPLLGWGLDAARAIPGGKDEIRPGQSWMPLHPHNAPLQLWLELGAPGALLLGLFIWWLWRRIAEARWPPLYAAASGGALTAMLAVAFAGWGIWQEWWLATLGMAAFVIIVMARAAQPVRGKAGQATL